MRAYFAMGVAIVGCVRTEVVECGFGTCPAGSVCDEVHQRCNPCGDGVVQVGEACDDANSTANDGCSASCTIEAPAWTQWRPTRPWTGRTQHAAAYDVMRQRMVVAGGFADASADPTVSQVGETWERGPLGWSRMMDGPLVYAASMTYDSAGGRVVLFGGGLAPVASDLTYEYRGAMWSLVQTSLKPPPRWGAAMVSSGTIALFGGINESFELLGDTWTLAGTTWMQRTVTTSPPARAYASAAYDPGRSKIVMFGGEDDNGALSDTWELDTSGWQRVFPSTSPPARRGAAMGFIGGRVVLFGGFDGTGVLNDTWEYNGTTWSQRALPVAPPARQNHTLAYDAAEQKLVLVGGAEVDEFAPMFDDVWEYAGVSWARKNPVFSPPDITGRVVLDRARDELVALGGNPLPDLGDTWRFDGTIWRRTVATTTAPPRDQYAIGYDSRRARLVVFGGTSGGPLGDTWELDGSTWSAWAGSGPPARYGAGMEFHEADGVLILVGGCVVSGCPSYAGDTWAFDGSTWTMISAATPGLEVYKPALTYDAARGKIILFGGKPGTGEVVGNQTWEYAGGTWTRVATTGEPPASFGQSIAYHPQRQRVILRSDSPPYLWELVDAAWTPIPVDGERPLGYGVLASRADSIVFVGTGETWFYRWGSTAR